MHWLMCPIWGTFLQRKAFQLFELNQITHIPADANKKLNNQENALDTYISKQGLMKFTPKGLNK